MLNPLVEEPTLASGSIYVILGSLFFPGAFLLLRHVLLETKWGRSLTKKYGMDRSDGCDVANKLVSSLFAVLACSTGLTQYLSCIGDDVIYQRHVLCDNFLCFGLSYFFYDIVAMYVVHGERERGRVLFRRDDLLEFVRRRPVMVVHHLLVPIVGFPVLIFLRDGIGDCLLGFSFLIELSTPFVSLRVILCHFKKKSSNLYIANGLIMLITFLMCRILIFPYMFMLYGRQEGMGMLEAIKAVPFHCKLFTLFLALPQLYWFALMLKGSLKIISKAFNKNYHHDY